SRTPNLDISLAAAESVWDWSRQPSVKTALNLKPLNGIELRRVQPPGSHAGEVAQLAKGHVPCHEQRTPRVRPSSILWPLKRWDQFSMLVAHHRSRRQSPAMAGAFLLFLLAVLVRMVVVVEASPSPPPVSVAY